MDEDTRAKLLAEIEKHARALTASLEKLTAGPERSIAISQIGEALRLARMALPEPTPDEG